MDTAALYRCFLCGFNVLLLYWYKHETWTESGVPRRRQWPNNNSLPSLNLLSIYISKQVLHWIFTGLFHHLYIFFLRNQEKWWESAKSKKKLTQKGSTWIKVLLFNPSWHPRLVDSWGKYIFLAFGCQSVSRTSTFMLVDPFMHFCSFFHGCDVKGWKRLFWPANGMQSTSLLVEIHIINCSLKNNTCNKS